MNNCYKCGKSKGVSTVNFCYWCDCFQGRKFITIEWRKPLEWIKRLLNIGINYK